MGSKSDELKALIEQAKQQLAATEFDMASLSPTTPKWSIPDRRIGMRAEVLRRRREPHALLFRIRSVPGRIYVLRRSEQTGLWDAPEVAG